MLKTVGHRLWLQRYLRRNAIDSGLLDRFSGNGSSAERKQILSEALLSQIQYFGRRKDALPEWKDAATIRDANELWKTWPQLPILTRRDMRERFDADEVIRTLGSTDPVNSTGGSTGEPVRFVHDLRMRKATVALDYWSRRWMGWKPGIPLVVVWGAEQDIGKNVSRKVRLNNWLLNESYVNGYRLSERTVDQVLELIRRKRPVALAGFSSMLGYVARMAIEMGRTPDPGDVAVAWNGGEMLTPGQVEVFQRAFGVPILNRYGGRELSVLACQSEPTGPLHVMRPWQFLEIVDESGRPVPPGQSGRLIWTSTLCRGTPFLRYDVGDWGSAAIDGQDESGVFALASLDGRSAGLAHTPDGKVVNNLFWNHALKEFAEIQQFQVHVRRDGSLHLMAQGRGFSDERERELRRMLEQVWGSTPLSVQWVEQIPLTASGKLIQVVVESSDSSSQAGTGRA